MSSVLESLLIGRNEPVSSARKWKIGTSQHGGRGVFAKCDIDSGELIFVDVPVLYGPKSNNNFIGCTGCSDNRKPLRSCSKYCRLPVCSEKCENLECHRKECNLLRNFNIDQEEWSPNFYRSLTLIRGLFMPEEDRKIVRLLHSNRGKQVDTQISVLQNLLGSTLNETEVDWMKHCCGVLDGTAFEIELEPTANSLKGLYPLSAMMNHNCVPNTRLSYTGGSSGYKMLVIASMFIPVGSEIFTSYCPLLWGTNLRRTFLLHTKHFRCKCERCQDPTEFCTNLQALRCKCGRFLLPTEPLNFNTEWQCESCGDKNEKFNGFIQKNLRFHSNLYQHIPDCNYIHVQGKIESIFKDTKNGVKGLNNVQLHDVMNTCIQILRLIEQLKLGNTQFKGRLCGQLEIVDQELLERGIEYNRAEIEKYCDIGKLIDAENKKAKETSEKSHNRFATISNMENLLANQAIVN